MEKHKINSQSSIKTALQMLNQLTLMANSPIMLLVLNDSNQMVGTVTDGDVRRGLMKGLSVDSEVVEIMNKNFHYVVQNKYNTSDLFNFKEREIWSVPLLNESLHVLDLLNLKTQSQSAALPVDAVIMAGGKGQRLYPLTKEVPKPMLKVGTKPILEINIERLLKFGIKNIHVSLNYLAHVITDYFDEKQKKYFLNYVKEDEPLGTIGSVSLIENFQNDYLLLMNSDLLTDVSFEDLFTELISTNADMIVASIPHRVSVPYAVFETKGKEIKKLAEKPTYTYHANAGIYLFKKEFLKYIPKKTFYNATDLMEALIKNNHKVLYYDIIGYWLDIGSPEDFEKAQQDILHLKL